jgi:hypothetical protein
MFLENKPAKKRKLLLFFLFTQPRGIAARILLVYITGQTYQDDEFAVLS